MTGDVAQTRWGPVQVQITVAGGQITDVAVVQYPTENGKDRQINARALPELIDETVSAQSADIDMVSRRDGDQRGLRRIVAERVGPGRAVTGTRVRAPISRRVVQVMGMPISLALRGRHTDGPMAEGAWTRVVASLREADLVFSTYRPDSCISRLGRGEIDLAACPLEVAEVLELGATAAAASGGAFDVRWRTDADATVFDPSGVVKGWAVDRAAAFLTTCPTPTSACPPAAT